MADTRAAYEEVGRLGIPTDAIWGTADQSVPIECAKYVKKAIPHATIHAFQGVDHAITYSRPDIVNPLLVKLVTGDGNQASSFN